ncbi:MAG: hypothetical protein ABI885_11315 [Gammaproteobacteria bacterium]
MQKLIVALIVAIAASGCSITLDAQSTPPEHLTRRVIDSDSREPVAGAYVIFTWWETRADLSHSSSRCARNEFRLTDETGSVKLPTWRGTYPIVTDVYKAGMVRVRSKLEKEGMELLQKSRAPVGERYQEMRMTRGRLGCEGGSGSLLPVYESLLHEALQLKTPSTDEKLFDGFEIARDSSQYGDDEARRMYIERLKARSRGIQQ